MFKPEFNDSVLEEAAKAICKGDTFCLFDIAATKNMDIGMATMMGGENFDAIVSMSEPSKQSGGWEREGEGGGEEGRGGGREGERPMSKFPDSSLLYSYLQPTL